MLQEFPKHREDQETLQASARAIDPIASLLRHWKLGLLAALIVLIAGIPFAWFKGRPIWRSEGVIYVSPRFQRNLETDPEHELQSNSQYREFVQQQVRTISRFDIAERAMAQGGEAAKSWKRAKEPERRAIDRLRGSLQISPVPDTYQVTVALEGEKAAGLADLVNAVMESYISTMQTELMYDSTSRLQHLETERTDLEQQIERLIEERTQIAQSLGTTVFSQGIVNSYDRMLGASSEALMEARRTRFIAEVGTVNGDSGAKGIDGVQAEALEKALSDTGLASLKSSLNGRKAELMARISGLSPQHAGRIAAEKEIQQIDNEIERVTQNLRARLAGNLAAIRGSKFQQASSVEDRLQQETKALRSQAESYSRAYQHSIDLGEEIERARKRQNAVEDRINYLRLETQAPGWVRVFSPAQQPDLPVQGGRRKLGLFVLLGALLIGIAVPIGVDYLDPRVREAQELEFHIGLPVTAWLPLADPDPSGAATVDADAILRAAVSIRRHLHELRHRALVLSAVSHGGGSTTFCLALAAALNRLGVRTLAIEANPLTPDTRYALKPNTGGLIQLMAGQLSIVAGRAHGAHGLPDRVSTGIGTAEELLPVERILNILEQTAAGYDLVLIDAAPITKSLPTEELIRVIGAAVIVTDAQKDRKRDVQECMQRLERLKPHAFGSVLNKVSAPPTLGRLRKQTHDSTSVFAA